MAVDGYMDAVKESGNNPASKHQIQSECGGDAGWNGRTYLARLNSQARTGTRKNIFAVQARFGNLTPLIDTLP